MISKKTFMKIAYNISLESKAKRRKVGCVIVKENNIIAVGYNGTPSGFDNNCEIEKEILNPIEENLMPKSLLFKEESKKFELITKPEVLHAESNAIAKCARSNSSSEGAELFTTTSPCFDCSKIIIQSGIKAVYYCEEYKDTKGLEMLKKAGIWVGKISENNKDIFSYIAATKATDDYFSKRNEGLLKHLNGNQGL
jgi:dCMP deaminase